MKWTFDDQTNALKEGWGIFELDGEPSSWEIQRAYEEEGIGVGYTFVNDWKAVKHVRAAAQNGHLLAIKALQVLGMKLIVPDMERNIK